MVENDFNKKLFMFEYIYNNNDIYQFMFEKFESQVVLGKIDFEAKIYWGWKVKLSTVQICTKSEK